MASEAPNQTSLSLSYKRFLKGFSPFCNATQSPCLAQGWPTKKVKIASHRTQHQKLGRPSIQIQVFFKVKARLVRFMRYSLCILWQCSMFSKIQAKTGSFNSIPIFTHFLSGKHLGDTEPPVEPDFSVLASATTKLLFSTLQVRIC